MAATHAWTVGAIGLLTLALMTRATRGHTGQPLTAPAGTVAISALALVAAPSRVAASLWPDAMAGAPGLAGMGRIGALALFVILYGPLLAKPTGER
jgi:uncharacterized protein involved in response to NO